MSKLNLPKPSNTVPQKEHYAILVFDSKSVSNDDYNGGTYSSQFEYTQYIPCESPDQLKDWILAENEKDKRDRRQYQVIKCNPVDLQVKVDINLQTIV